jgi:hypothetical protein
MARMMTLYRRWAAREPTPTLRPRFELLALAIAITIALALAPVITALDTERAWVLPFFLLVALVVTPFGRGVARRLQRRRDAR